ncbi:MULTISPECIES: LacI family DNA-binding transcriptional regulator [unclassified Microbacterium]|uniref:LacI family DNA-binding transcriptional regulator n=1 Tax=Microbacterium TaxID=33882 RepID=UPI003B9E7E52
MKDSAAAGRRKNVTINDVAAAAGVSKSMVSYALNGRPEVNEQTRERIVETARHLGWTPSLRGRALSKARAFAIGLIFHRTVESLSTDQFYTLFTAGVQDVLSARGYALVTEVVSSDEEEREAYIRFARDGRVDGFLLTDVRDDDPRFAYVREHGMAALVMEATAQAPGLPVLRVSNDRPAAEAVVDRLADLGHRRIGIIAGLQSLASGRGRLRLFQEALAARGLEDVAVEYGDYSPESGAAACARLLRRDATPTAIIAANDMMAIAAIAEAQRQGRRVPDDVSVVGWENIPLSALLQPALSSVSSDPFWTGQQGARALLGVIDGHELPEPAIRVPRFVERDSIGPVPGRH